MRRLIVALLLFCAAADAQVVFTLVTGEQILANGNIIGRFGFVGCVVINGEDCVGPWDLYLFHPPLPPPAPENPAYGDFLIQTERSVRELIVQSQPDPRRSRYSGVHTPLPYEWFLIEADPLRIESRDPGRFFHREPFGPPEPFFKVHKPQ